MTDPTAHGSSLHRGSAGQPLAEQPTIQVVYDRQESGHEPSYRRDPDLHGLRDPHPDDLHPRGLHLLDPHPVDLDRAHGWDSPDGDLDDVHDLDDVDDPDDLDDLDHLDDLDDLDHLHDEPGWTPDRSATPVAVRRADVVAGLLLLLAGMAAGVSLLVVWVNGGDTGLDLVRGALADARDGAAGFGGSGSWQPLAVVGSGVVLFVLGLLMYVPARTHRLLGVLALLVALVASAGVLVPLADAGWDLEGFAVGAWFAVAVPGPGLLGALKAMGTGPRAPRP